MSVYATDALEMIHADVHRHAVEAAETYGICLVDIDRFGAYATAYGEAASNELLASVAGALKGSLRSSDVLVRFDRRRIAILLPGMKAYGAATVAARLCRSVASLDRPHRHNGEHGMVTASTGIAAFVPATLESPQHLLQRADVALDAAVDCGGNAAITARPPAAKRTINCVCGRGCGASS